MTRRRVVRLRRFATVAVAATAVSVASVARAQSISRTKDEPVEKRGEGIANDEDPIRGSTFLFDQSMSTQTAHLEPQPQQSYVPFYGWWLSLRPRWNFSDKLRLQGRFDYFKEFTNSQETTYDREDVFGDIWTDLIYATPLAEDGLWKNTKVTLGARALWPTSKTSQAQGTYVSLGAIAGVNQNIPIQGPDAPVLDGARVGVSAQYTHAFTNATTATNYGNEQGPPGQTPEEQSIPLTHDITGQPIGEHTLYGVFDTGLDITPQLGLTVDWILINTWHYIPRAACVTIANGQACPPRIDDNQFTQLGWFIAEADYEVIPEMSIGLGYYNLANILGPNGQTNTPWGSGENNVLWSPDARVFLDVTANLDALYEDASGSSRSKPGKTAAAARAARQQALTSAAR